MPTITEFLKSSGKYIDKVKEGEEVVITTTDRRKKVTKMVLKLKEDK